MRGVRGKHRIPVWTKRRYVYAFHTCAVYLTVLCTFIYLLPICKEKKQ